MLLVRELLLGPKRFSELRRGLPGASQSMLVSRLTELEAAGVLRRRHLGPPVGTSVYELTAWGRELEPALLRLAGWGSRAPLTSQAELLAFRGAPVADANALFHGDRDLVARLLGLFRRPEPAPVVAR
jgi:DNA-binding HxlR family transcriptional regulator